MFRDIPVIALEEHYWDKELVGHVSIASPLFSKEAAARLFDFDELRLREMDEAGIDLQVISHSMPSAEEIPASIASDLVKRVNDRLAEVCRRHPSRFAAFAALPTAVPDRAADELERCVVDLGFKGALVHPLTDGVFFDDQRFWPIFETAEKLGVPIYLHPGLPHADVTKVYYQDYAERYPAIVGAALGFGLETAVQAVRLILSRLFKKHSKLTFILGHMGEALPFILWRTHMALSRQAMTRSISGRSSAVISASRRAATSRRQRYYASCLN
jgi:predicted TIM-barrel fold metal-dependent hydrolase